LNPLYIDDRYRPDSLTKKSWDEVIQELDKQEEALLEDPRVNG
jgi:hypothetical protein